MQESPLRAEIKSRLSTFISENRFEEKADREAIKKLSELVDNLGNPTKAKTLTYQTITKQIKGAKSVTVPGIFSPWVTSALFKENIDDLLTDINTLKKDQEIAAERQRFEREREAEQQRLEKEREAEKQEKEMSRKRKREEEEKQQKTVNDLMEGLTTATTQLEAAKDELQAAKVEIKESYKNGYSKGLFEGEERLITELQLIASDTKKPRQLRLTQFAERIRLGDKLPLLLTDGREEPQQQKTQHADVTAAEQEIKNLMGDAKFNVVKTLKEVSDNPDVTNHEKILANFLIFQLLLHKNDKAINIIVSDTKELLKEHKGITKEAFPQKFPSIHLLDSFFTKAKMAEAISGNPLEEVEAKGIYDLYKKSKENSSAQTFVPMDMTAFNIFGFITEALQNGRPVDFPSKEKEYATNFLKKLPANNMFIHKQPSPQKPKTEPMVVEVVSPPKEQPTPVQKPTVQEPQTPKQTPMGARATRSTAPTHTHAHDTSHPGCATCKAKDKATPVSTTKMGKKQ